MDEANRFLEEHFVPFWQGRFTVDPAEPADAHRPLPGGVDLLRLFAETEQRVIRADFTFRYKNVHYQIEKKEADGAMPKSRVTIEHRLDGTTRYRWKGRYLSPTPLPGGQPAAPTETTAPKKERRLTGTAGKPVPADHPWRRFPVRVGRNDPLRPRVAASAASSLRPDSPASGNGRTLS